MAIQNKESFLISFDSKKQLKILKNIVKKYGKNCNVLVKTKVIRGVQVITEVYPLDKAPCEDAYQMTAKDCFLQLKKQESIV